MFGDGCIVRSRIGLDAPEPFIRRREFQKIMRRTFAGRWIAARTTCKSSKGAMSAMAKYEFTLILKGSRELTEEVADELFQAGCDDGTPGTSDGVFSIDFHRVANTLEEAINSAIGNLKLAGYEVDRVEIEADAMPQPA
jgi:hypothetical protein